MSEFVANWAWTFLLVGLTVWMLFSAMTRPGKVYEFPFLAAAMTFAFILPQLPGLAIDRFLPAGAYAKTTAFTVFCLAACQIGWSLRVKPMRLIGWTFDEKKLLVVATVFSLVGAFFYFRLSRLSGEVTIGTIISGLPVIYLFFARLLTYGLAIALLCLAHRFSWPAFCLVAFDCLFYLDRILVTGKRGETLELVMLFALAFWFYSGRALPRLAVLTGLIAGTLAMGSTEDYRNITRDAGRPVWSAITDINVVENFENILRHGGPEMRNAILRVAAIDRTKELDYGIFHWNILVFNYVPAQIFGPELKESLMTRFPGEYDREYDPSVGSTETGMADAFGSFWYFGAVKFLLIAMAMRSIYAAAMEGRAGAQILYMLSAVPAMHTISHHTQWIVTLWVHMAFFLLPALLFARQSRDKSADPGPLTTDRLRLAAGHPS
jgi:hypothetical protein